MLTKTIKLLSLLLFICLTGSALAQSSQQSSQNNQQAAKTESPFVDFSGFKGKVLEVKNRDPHSLASLLAPLGSGFKGAELRANSEFKTITVRDFPENIAAIEEALKRLDTPSIKAEPSIELTLHILVSNTGLNSDPVPADLQSVITQLQKTFTFKDYQLVASTIQRAKVKGRGGNAAFSGRGSATWKEWPDGKSSDSPSFMTRNADYEYRANTIEAISSASSVTTVQINEFTFNFGKSSIFSNLELRDGEKVVVGTSSVGDKALILVLTAKVLK